MTLEQIPQYTGGKPITDSSLRGWLGRHDVVLLVSIAVLLVLDAAVAGYFLTIGRTSPGGLDGCLYTASGQPMPGATVAVGNYTTATYPDGCFFFAELPAGQNDLIVQGETGDVIFSQSVDIPSDQALGLGSITVP
jgi:hypothetical protein